MENQEKLEMAEAFMKSAEILDGPIFAIRTDSKETIEDQKDAQRIQRKQVSYFLYALIFELAIKVIWEIEKGKKCKPTHNILKLYKELPYETQSQIRELYDRQAFIIKTQEGQQKTGKQIHLGDLTNFQPLEEALKANYNIVTDFKYDGYFQGKSSVIAGVIWNTQDLWTLPDKFVVFPRELLEYTRKKAESQ